MKLPLSLFILFLILTGCKKEEIVQDPRFNQFQGHWRGYNGTEQLDIYLKKNGVVTVAPENERGFRFRTREILDYTNTYPIYGVYMRGYTFRENTSGSLTTRVSFYQDTVSGKIYVRSPFSVQDTDLQDSSVFIQMEKL